MEAYTEADLAPHHPPNGDPEWQESTFVAWWDEDAGIGGMHRIGHEVNLGLGNAWVGVYTREGGRLALHEPEIPLRDGDRSADGTSKVGDLYTVRNQPGSIDWSLRHGEATAELHLSEFYAPTHLWNDKTESTVHADIAPRHYENAGRVEGEITFRGKNYEINNGLFYRDLSWGCRRYRKILSARWMGGTFGPDLSFGSLLWQQPDGSVTRVGYTVRDGQIDRTDDVDIVVYTEPDGYTHRGGWGVIGPGSEQEVLIDVRLLDGAVFGQRAWQELNTLSIATDAQGRTGFVDLHSINNARGGVEPVPHGIGAAVRNESVTHEPFHTRPRTFEEAVRQRQSAVARAGG